MPTTVSRFQLVRNSAIGVVMAGTRGPVARRYPQAGSNYPNHPR